MANINGNKQWSPVRLLEHHELARGGLGGNMNEQAQALADRTEFLMEEKASKSEIVQGVYEYGTFAEFDSEKENLPLNCTVVIGEENHSTSSEWGLGNNRWDGFILKKSSYDPVQQSNKKILALTNEVFKAAGKNLFNKNDVVAGEQYSPANQKIVVSSAYRRSPFIPVVAGKTYTLSGNLMTAVQIAWYTTADKASLAISNSTTKTATAPSGAKFAVFNITNTGANDSSYDGTTQFEEGIKATSYEPYINLIAQDSVAGLPEILAETLIESDVIEKVSFNLIDISKINFTKRYSTGSKNFVTDNLGIAASDWIPVIEGEWYTLSGDGKYGEVTGTGQGGYFTAYGELNAIQNIEFVIPVDRNGHAFKVPVGFGITHVVVSLKKLNAQPTSTTLHGTVQLEKGEMATAYQPYNAQPLIKAKLIPSNNGGGTGNPVQINDAGWYKYVKADGVQLYPDKLPNFRKHHLLKDKDIVVINTGTSLTARTSEHSSLRSDGPLRPPMMHSNAFCSHIWDALKWDGQQYRRYDSGYFTESGTFVTASNLSNWDDGAYRDGLTRYSESANASVQFKVPVDAWQFNFIYRTDSIGCEAKVTVAEGAGNIQVFDETSQAWVEANNYLFSMIEPTPVTRTVNIPNPVTGALTAVTLASKGNTTYQKRLKMRCRDNVSLNSLSIVKNVTVANNGTGRLMYWGVEWTPRQFMITYINSARGSHNTNATGSSGLPRFQDNEIWSFKPDLILSELGIHNDGAAAAGTYPVGQWAGLTNNYITNTEYELSMFSRSSHFGISPEYAFFTASIAWNFGGINDDGSLKYSLQTVSVKGPVKAMSALDKYQEATQFLREKHPEIVAIDATKRWVDAGISIFGNLKTATEGSGKTGSTFTNEGSHWNDTGSAVMAKAVIPILL